MTGTLKLNDVSNMKLPQLPCSKKDYEAFIRRVMNRLSMTGADTLITLKKEDRANLPVKPELKNGK